MDEHSNSHEYRRAQSFRRLWDLFVFMIRDPVAPKRVSLIMAILGTQEPRPVDVRMIDNKYARRVICTHEQTALSSMVFPRPMLLIPNGKSSESF
jgi:hypothetical protein